MSFKNQSVFSSVFTNTTFTITEEMQISEVSIEVVSGTATLLGGLQIPGFVNIPVSLDFNQPVVLKANKGYTLTDITIDSTAGGVFEIIGIYGYNDGVDPAAQSFFTATGITGATQQAAIDNLVKSLKGYGLWSKMKAIYPFVTDNYNILSYTEDFGNAVWVNSDGASVVTNQTTAPNGTLTADLLQFSSNELSRCQQFPFANTTYTFSVWIKTVTGTTTVRFGNWDNLEVFNVTNDWQRINITKTATSNGVFTIRNNAAGNSSAVYVWGAQLQTGSTLTDYQPITTTQQSYISAQFKYNLKDPRDLDAAYRLVFSGGWTFSSTGAQGNGVNGFANTYISALAVLSQNNSGASVYTNSNATFGTLNRTDVLLGSSNSSGVSFTNGFYLLPMAASDAKEYSRLNSSTGPTAASWVDCKGFYQFNRLSSSFFKTYRNTSNVQYSIISAPATSNNIYLGGLNAAGTLIEPSNNTIAFSTINDGLTDTEAANFYMAVQTYQEALSRQVGVPVVSDPNAQAFIDAAQITDVTQADAINNLVLGLKYNGLWTKMKAVYPFVGGTASTHKFNLMNPVDSDAAYRLVFNGGWTHSSNGATPNGTNGFANTYFTPSSALTTSSAHFSKYNRTNDLVGDKLDGTFFPATTSWFQQNYTQANGIMGNGAPAVYTATDTRGLFTTTRTATNLIKVFRNSANVASNTDTVTTLPGTVLFLGARNDGGTGFFWNTYQTAFASIGDGLTDADALNLYTIVQAYQTALGRQV